jgi:hypothetical protein
MNILVAALRQSGLGDLFQSGSALANLGVLGLLGVAVVFLVWLHIRAYNREIERGDRALAGWDAATTQFERALDLIEKMQNRSRRGDDR